MRRLADSVHARLSGPSTVLGALNLGCLGLLIWGVTSETAIGLGGAHLSSLVLVAVAAAMWVATLVPALSSTPWGLGVVVVLAVAGGILVIWAPLALIFPAVAAFRAAHSWPLVAAVAITVLGFVTVAIAVGAAGKSWAILSGVVAASIAGVSLGAGRRYAVEQAHQAATVHVERERAEVERARAELLAERNHLARELHDVLAHTLSALSVQLEAFASVIDADSATSPAVREHLDESRQLVRVGLAEARRAVEALRDDPTPLAERVAKLCADHGAAYTLSGTPRPLSPQAALGLFRASQEALTNAAKHAPGAPVNVALSFVDHRVSLVVDNGPPAREPDAITAPGGGYGLRGIEERLALLGGSVAAGPHVDGWRVAAEVPARE